MSPRNINYLPGLRLPQLGFIVNLFLSFTGGVNNSHLEMTSLRVRVGVRDGNFEKTKGKERECKRKKVNRGGLFGILQKFSSGEKQGYIL